MPHAQSPGRDRVLESTLSDHWPCRGFESGKVRQGCIRFDCRLISKRAVGATPQLRVIESIVRFKLQLKRTLPSSEILRQRQVEVFVPGTLRAPVTMLPTEPSPAGGMRRSNCRKRIARFRDIGVLMLRPIRMASPHREVAPSTW